MLAHVAVGDGVPAIYQRFGLQGTIHFLRATMMGPWLDRAAQRSLPPTTAIAPDPLIWTARAVAHGLAQGSPAAPIMCSDFAANGPPHTTCLRPADGHNAGCFLSQHTAATAHRPGLGPFVRLTCEYLVPFDNSPALLHDHFENCY